MAGAILAPSRPCSALESDFGAQRQRPHSSLNGAFIYAGNNLSLPRAQPKSFPHTLACTGAPNTPASGVVESTIGPAGLNLRRLEGVSERTLRARAFCRNPERSAAESKDLVSKEKAVEISLNGLYLCRQRPTLPHTFACSTIGPAGLNFRVRDGNGWNPRGVITDKS
jgi:hypothetical protein